jgi:hypothetical protein
MLVNKHNISFSVPYHQVVHNEAMKEALLVPLTAGAPGKGEGGRRREREKELKRKR